MDTTQHCPRCEALARERDEWRAKAEARGKALETLRRIPLAWGKDPEEFYRRVLMLQHDSVLFVA